MSHRYTIGYFIYVSILLVFPVLCIQAQDNIEERMLGPLPIASPGTQLAITTYDEQHLGTMGRQVSFTAGSEYIHFFWTGQFSNDLINGPRFVYYQAWDDNVHDMTQMPGGRQTLTDFSEYASASSLENGEAIFACFTDSADMGYKISCVFSDAFPGGGFFVAGSYMPYYGGDQTAWPKVEVHYGTDSVKYVLGRVEPIPHELVVFRQGPTGSFDAGQLMATCSTHGFTITSSPVSDKVAVVYADDRSGIPDGSGPLDLDIWYRESTDQGLTWGTPNCVSNYSIDSTWRAFNDLSALYDTYGNLHIVWAARMFEDTGSIYEYRSRLVHWDDANNVATFIEHALYDMGPGCIPGKGNLYLAKPTISECDGKLYCLWTQFGSEDQDPYFDCSSGGYANGELYMSVSEDYGYTWDRGMNMTNSYTPGCDSNDCESDHWASMPKYGKYFGSPDSLDILYINDKDAGSIRRGEGTWTVNPVMWLRTMCRDGVPAPRLYLETSDFFADPVQVDPFEQLDTNWVLTNLGNMDLNYNITIEYYDDFGWLDGGSLSGVVPVGADNTETVNLTFNVGGMIDEPSTLDAYFVLTTDQSKLTDTIPVRMQVGSGDPWSPLTVWSIGSINIRVTDPDALIIGKDSLGFLTNQISGAIYYESPNDSIVIDNTKPGTYTFDFIREAGLPKATYTYMAIIKVDGTQSVIIVDSEPVPGYGLEDTYTLETEDVNIEEEIFYVNGDANGDGVVNIGDAVRLVNIVFNDGLMPQPYYAGDANCDLTVNVGDAVYIITLVFHNGPSPCILGE